jgi:hypothetical protein
MIIETNVTLSIKKIDEEIFILDRKNSAIHTFNKTGTVIWDLLVKKASIEQIEISLQDRFEVDKETALKDINEFLNELKDKKLINMQ